MGIIKDGSISGRLPSDEAFAVHYPAYPSSIERAVETLGGTDAIAKARSSKENKLELHSRPEDPYSHPAFGKLQNCTGFLMKISKTKTTDIQNAENSNLKAASSSANPVILEERDSESEFPKEARLTNQPQAEKIIASGEVTERSDDVQGHLTADIVARVSEAYYFNGMVDYQHVLAVHADVARRKKRNWADLEPQFEKCGLMDIDQEDLMILVPPLFSLKDEPTRVVLKPSAVMSKKKKEEGFVQSSKKMDIEPSLQLDFSIKEIPKKVNWENDIPQGTARWELQKAVSELLDERPIWFKESMAECLLDRGLKFDERLLQRILFETAYYFSNGPFRRLWIRRGYDPRKDPESRIYQNIDFRTPPLLRSSCNTGTVAGLKDKRKDICSFRIFPFKHQTALQLYELEDEYIQEEIRKPCNQHSCSCATGWFTADVYDSLRLRVTIRFLSVYPNSDAESLLKDTSRRFEKLKRRQKLTQDSKLDDGRKVGEDPDQLEPLEVRDDEYKEPDDVEEDEEDEIEDYNFNEDMDADEELDLDYHGGNATPQQGSYTNPGNISRSYLQDLFGTFPVNGEGVDKLQDADNSDGEYQIYDQYSDDNHSDDDNC